MVVGYGVAVVTQILVCPVFGVKATIGANLSIGLVFTAIRLHGHTPLGERLNGSDTSVSRCATNVCFAPISLKKSAWRAAAPGKLTLVGGAGALCRLRCRHRDELGELPEVLGGCCEMELVAGAVRSA